MNTSGAVHVGRTGELISNLGNIEAVLVEGKLVGHIIGETVIIKSSGIVFGNITCKNFFADSGSVLVGSLNIHKVNVTQHTAYN